MKKPKYSELEKKIIREIDAILAYEIGDERGTIRNTISDIRVGNNPADVFVTTTRPGILIGKAGRTIDKLTLLLAKEMNRPDLKIHIVEDHFSFPFIDQYN